MIWHERERAVLLAASAAVRRNVKNSSRKASQSVAFFSSRRAAKMETKRTIRSAEVDLRGKSKRGFKVLENEEKKRGREEEDRIAESSLSFRGWTA